MSPRIALALLVGAFVLAALLPARADEDEEPPLDYAYYKARVAPVLHEACGACHADRRERRKVGRFFLWPSPGRRIRERFHERNFETVLDLVEPGDPSTSLLLLKAIGPRAGGVTHEGGAILGTNTPGYGAIIDWIQGARQAPEPFRIPESEEGRPDFLFFYHRIEPVLLGVCAECHGGRGKGRFKLVTHERGEEFPLEDHYRNFETVLDLLEPGRPDRSRFLAKPLAVEDGGIRHRGGDRIRAGSSNHQNWIDFINGVKGPPLPTPGERVVPRLTAEGLVVQAEDFVLTQGAEAAEIEGAQSFYVVRAEGTPGGAWTDLEVVDPGAYTMAFRVHPDTAPLRWRLAGGPWRELPVPPATERDAQGFATTGPRTLLDGDTPLQAARGGLRLEGEVLHMDGRDGAAAWLSPSRVRNEGCVAHVRMAHEEEGGDDALLLFDMDDVDNGKFVGLTDGGRRFVMGLREGGRLRVLEAVKAPPQREADVGGPRRIRVAYYGGVAVGSLDDRPLLFLNLSNMLDRGRFGVLTHGLADVHRVAALEEYEVYRVDFRVGPVVDFPAGRQRIEVDLPPDGGAFDALVLEPSGG